MDIRLNLHNKCIYQANDIGIHLQLHYEIACQLNKAKLAITQSANVSCILEEAGRNLWIEMGNYTVHLIRHHRHFANKGVMGFLVLLPQSNNNIIN